MGILKPLKIGELTARRPIVQGGMGVGISPVSYTHLDVYKRQI